MREIKFRAIKCNSACNEWIYGFICPYDEMIDINTIDYSRIDIIPHTVGQYTGLKDKNGKEIYEGDIIVEDNIKCLVIWNDKIASFALSKSGWMFDHFFGEGVNAEMCEVIGNKCQYPDLLIETSKP